MRGPRPRLLLRHLILMPTGGLCNRLRAIASARRLCAMSGARCTLLWDWGDFGRFFVETPDLEVCRKIRAAADVEVCHYPRHVNPSRAVDAGARVVVVQSGYVFHHSDEPRIQLADVLPFVPELHARLMKRVERFGERHLRNAVGFHVRRTDNGRATRNSPDRLFIECAREVAADGGKIFLATDNTATEAKFRAVLGDAVITHPKRRILAERWPREFDALALEDDLVDLHLLAGARYVVGCDWSSYSGMAMALNGSPRCRVLKLEGLPLADVPPPKRQGPGGRRGQGWGDAVPAAASAGAFDTEAEVAAASL
jgi:hypothetical protein